MKKLKLIALLAAFCAVPAFAHAAGVPLLIGNAIFSGLYSVGVAGGVANFIANSAFAISCVGSNGKASFK